VRRLSDSDWVTEKTTAFRGELKVRKTGDKELLL